jgi:hypothetical protein
VKFQERDEPCHRTWRKDQTRLWDRADQLYRLAATSTRRDGGIIDRNPGCELSCEPEDWMVAIRPKHGDEMHCVNLPLPCRRGWKTGMKALRTTLNIRHGSVRRVDRSVMAAGNRVWQKQQRMKQASRTTEQKLETKRQGERKQAQRISRLS